MDTSYHVVFGSCRRYGGLLPSSACMEKVHMAELLVPWALLLEAVMTATKLGPLAQLGTKNRRLN